MKLKAIVSGVCALAMLAAGSVCAKEVVKVGVVTPLSGNLAMIKELADAMQIRVDEENVNNAHRYEYRFIFEDSQFDPKRSHMAAMKLIDVDKVDMLISVAALSSKVIDPLAARARIPQLAIASENPTKQPWTFTYFTTAMDTADLLLSTAKGLGMHSYVTMGVREQANVLIADAMRTLSKDAGMTCLGDLLWNDSETKDFRGHLLKVKELNPDFISFFPNPPDADIIFKQHYELGLTIPLVGIESLDLVDDKERWLNNVWVAGCPLIGDGFRAKMAQHGLNIGLAYTPYAYDLPAIAIAAVESAEVSEGAAKPTGEQIRASFENLKTLQTSQGEVALDDKGAFHPMPVLVYYQDGKPREVSYEELEKLLAEGAAR